MYFLLIYTHVFQHLLYFYLMEINVGAYFRWQVYLERVEVMFDQEREETFLVSYKVTKVMPGENV